MLRTAPSAALIGVARGQIRRFLEYSRGGAGGENDNTYTYDIADKLTRETEGETETAYLYDANGSLTRKTQGETVEAYAYNYENMMTSYGSTAITLTSNHDFVGITSPSSTHKAYESAGRKRIR